MRIRDLLETFDKPHEYRWITQTHRASTAEFDIGDATYFVAFHMVSYRDRQVCRFDFGLSESSATALGLVSTRPTDLRTPMQVISTVRQIVKDFVIERHPEFILFYDNDNLPSRKRAYQRLFADWLADRFGYQLVDQDEVTRESVWLLRRG